MRRNRLFAIIVCVALTVALFPAPPARAAGDIELLSHSTDGSSSIAQATVKNNGPDQRATVIVRRLDKDGRVMNAQSTDINIQKGSTQTVNFVFSSPGGKSLEFMVVEDYGDGVVLAAVVSDGSRSASQAVLTNGGKAKGVILVVKRLDKAGNLISIKAADVSLGEKASKTVTMSHDARSGNTYQYLVVEDYGSGLTVPAYTTDGSGGSGQIVMINGGARASYTLSVIVYDKNGDQLYTGKRELTLGRNSAQQVELTFPARSGSTVSWFIDGEAVKPADLPAVATRYVDNAILSGASSWARDEIGQALALGLVPDELQGDYPNEISRREFCALVIQTLMARSGMDKIAFIEAHEGVDLSAKPFSDTGDEQVVMAYGLGIVKGTGGGRFTPDGPITRQDAAAMLKRAAAVQGLTDAGAPVKFSDSGTVAGYAKEGVDFVSATGIMGGIGDGRFDSLGVYTREQAILTMLRLFRAIG